MYILFTGNNNNNKTYKASLFFILLTKLKSVTGSFSFFVAVCCFPVFDGFPNNFTISLCICDVPILMWVIPTIKPGTRLRVWETTAYLCWVSGVLPTETLTLCNVISATCLFCHLSLLFLPYPGEMPARLVKEACDVCRRDLKHLADVSPRIYWNTRTLLASI